MASNIHRSRSMKSSGSVASSSVSSWFNIFSAYRIFFSCAHVGKVIPSSKRIITWKFGFSNEEAIGDGLTGTDCRGEEHEVKFRWSVRSGRVQVVYNSKDITSLGSFLQNASSLTSHSDQGGHIGVPRTFTSGSDARSHGSASSTGNTTGSASTSQNRGRSFVPKIPILTRDMSNETNSQDSVNSKRSARSNSPSAPSFIEFTWLTSAQHQITIRAHLSPPPGYHQYDLLIDGRSFLSLPTAYELGTKEYAVRNRDEIVRRQTPSPVQCSANRVQTKRGSSTSQSLHNDSNRVQSHVNSQGNDDLLVSTHDSLVDIVRQDVESTVPGTEMMMSRAIICAFSEDRDLSEILPTASTREKAKQDPLVYETDCIYAASEWMKWNARSSAHDMVDRKCSFLQTQINRMVAAVRHNLISPVAASQAIHSVAAVLDMDLAVPLPRNTIVLFGLRKDVKREHVLNALQVYGKIDGVSVASGNKGFAVCRFRGTQASNRALGASFRDEIIIQHVSPQVRELSQFSASMNATPSKLQPRRHQSASTTTKAPQQRKHPGSQTFDAAGVRSYQRGQAQAYRVHSDEDMNQFSNHFAGTSISHDGFMALSPRDKHETNSLPRATTHTTTFDDFSGFGLVRKPSLDDGGRFHLPSSDFPFDVGNSSSRNSRNIQRNNDFGTYTTIDDKSAAFSRSKSHGSNKTYDSVSTNYGEF